MGFCGDICISDEIICTVTIDPNNFITVGVYVYFLNNECILIFDEIG